MHARTKHTNTHKHKRKHAHTCKSTAQHTDAATHTPKKNSALVNFCQKEAQGRGEVQKQSRPQKDTPDLQIEATDWQIETTDWTLARAYARMQCAVVCASRCVGAVIVIVQ